MGVLFRGAFSNALRSPFSDAPTIVKCFPWVGYTILRPIHEMISEDTNPNIPRLYDYLYPTQGSHDVH